MRTKYIALNLLILLVLLTMSAGISAQDTSGMCPILVDRALSYVGNNCANVGRNTICYGHTNVLSQFTDDSVLSDEADRAELRNLVSVQTMPFNSTDGVWGITVLNVQANLPNTIPGQGVRLVMLGDVRVENAVDPAEALVLPEEALEVTVGASGAELYELPLEWY